MQLNTVLVYNSHIIMHSSPCLDGVMVSEGVRKYKRREVRGRVRLFGLNELDWKQKINESKICVCLRRR